MSIELQDLILAIPTAEDGHVITSEYHNTLLAAIRSLATQAGAPLGETVLTLAPGFLPNEPVPRWTQRNGIAIMDLEVANLGEIQARARAEGEAAVAAAVAAAAKARAAAAALGNIPATFALVADALAASNEAATGADEAAVAARALVAAVANPDAAAKAAVAVTAAQNIVQTALRAFSLANAAQSILIGLRGGFSFVSFAVDALTNAGLALENGGEAFERAKNAEAAVAEAVDAEQRVKTGTSAGWLSVHLPDGVRIKNMVVSGRKRGTTQRFQVNLVRQNISDSSETILISLALTGAGDPFRLTANFLSPVVTAPGPFSATTSFDNSLITTGSLLRVSTAGRPALPALPPATAQDGVVDNTQYKYLITARVDGIEGALAQINAILVGYSG